jgi:hypothetical protein
MSRKYNDMDDRFFYTANRAGQIQVTIESRAAFEKAAGAGIDALLPVLTADTHTIKELRFRRSPLADIWYVDYDTPNIYRNFFDGNQVAYDFREGYRWALYHSFYPTIHYQGDGSVFMRNVLKSCKLMDIPALSLNSSLGRSAYYYARVGAHPVDESKHGWSSERSCSLTRQRMTVRFKHLSDFLPEDVRVRLQDKIAMITPETFATNPAFMRSIAEEKHRIGPYTAGFLFIDPCGGHRIFEVNNERHMQPIMEYLEDRVALSIACTPRSELAPA